MILFTNHLKRNIVKEIKKKRMKISSLMNFYIIQIMKHLIIKKKKNGRIMMSHIDIQYKEIVEKILQEGHLHKNRTGIDTLSVFGTSVRLNLQEGFPILTTKKVFYRQAFHETLWMFIQGSSDCKYLKDNNTTIWAEWTCYDEDHPNGTIGNLYGPVLRAYRVNREDPSNTIDQLQRCIDLIKTNPNSRRIVMTAFDPRFVADEQLSFEDNVKTGNGVLNPCHSNFIQFKVTDGKLSGYFTQRSGDFFLRNSV